MEEKRLCNQGAPLSHVGVTTSDLRADVLMPSQAELPVVDPRQLLPKTFDAARGAVREEPRDITAALTRVLQLPVVLVAGLVAVVGDQVCRARGHSARDEYEELTQARRPTVAVTRRMYPGKVQMSQ